MPIGTRDMSSAHRTLNVQDYLRLRMLLARCQILRHDRMRGRQSLAPLKAPRMPASLARATVGWFRNSLYLASVHVLVENWDKCLAYDEAVCRLLAQRGCRSAVQEFRNSVFHTEALLDPQNVRSRGRVQDLLRWADGVVDGVKTYFDTVPPPGLTPP